jgi:hypothetical protein
VSHKPRKLSVSNPDTAAYTKSKPRVRDYMSEHRAADPQASDDDPGNTVAPKEAQPAAHQVPPEHAPQPTPPLDRSHPSPANPLIEARMKVPEATGSIFDAALDTTMSLRLPFCISQALKEVIQDDKPPARKSPQNRLSAWRCIPISPGLPPASRM